MHLKILIICKIKVNVNNLNLFYHLKKTQKKKKSIKKTYACAKETGVFIFFYVKKTNSSVFSVPIHHFGVVSSLLINLVCLL